MDLNSLAIIIVNWNTCRLLKDCLDSILANTPNLPVEIWVVDNASSDDSTRMVRERFPQVHLIENLANVGFARANNQAFQRCNEKYVLLLNPDTIVHPGALDSLVRYLDGQTNVAGVGPRLLNPNGSIQPSIERLPSLFREWWRLFHLDRLYPVSQYPKSVLTSKTPQRVEVLNGACILLNTDVVRSMGLFDEDYFVYSEEIDLCDRLGQAGWELHWLPEAVVTHAVGRSTSLVAEHMFLELYRNKIKFFRKRRSVLTAAVYKFILLQASLARIALGQVARVMPLYHRQAWVNAARQYGFLLTALPSL